jgi:hypothetical protein
MNIITSGHRRARFGNIHEGVKKKASYGATHAAECILEDSGYSLGVVIVYNDMHAVLRAVETLDRLGRKFHGEVRQRLLPVPVSHLHDPDRFDHLLSDANSADLIIVSFNDPGDFPATLKQWIRECITQKRESGSAIVALLSSDERLDAPDSPRYQFIKQTAQAAGLDFLAPKSGVEEEIYPGKAAGGCRLRNITADGEIQRR